MNLKWILFLFFLVSLSSCKNNQRSHDFYADAHQWQQLALTQASAQLLVHEGQESLVDFVKLYNLQNVKEVKFPKIIEVGRFIKCNTSGLKCHFSAFKHTIDNEVIILEALGYYGEVQKLQLEVKVQAVNDKDGDLIPDDQDDDSQQAYYPHFEFREINPLLISQIYIRDQLKDSFEIAVPHVGQDLIRADLLQRSQDPRRPYAMMADLAFSSQETGDHIFKRGEYQFLRKNFKLKQSKIQLNFNLLIHDKLAEDIRDVWLELSGHDHSKKIKTLYLRIEQPIHLIHENQVHLTGDLEDIDLAEMVIASQNIKIRVHDYQALIKNQWISLKSRRNAIMQKNHLVTVSDFKASHFYFLRKDLSLKQKINKIVKLEKYSIESIDQVSGIENESWQKISPWMLFEHKDFIDLIYFDENELIQLKKPWSKKTVKRKIYNHKDIIYRSNAGQEKKYIIELRKLRQGFLSSVFSSKAEHGVWGVEKAGNFERRLCQFRQANEVSSTLRPIRADDFFKKVKINNGKLLDHNRSGSPESLALKLTTNHDLDLSYLAPKQRLQLGAIKSQCATNREVVHRGDPRERSICSCPNNLKPQFKVNGKEVLSFCQTNIHFAKNIQAIATSSWRHWIPERCHKFPATKPLRYKDFWVPVDFEMIVWSR